MITATGASNFLGHTKNHIYCPGFHKLFIFRLFLNQNQPLESTRNKSIAIYDTYVDHNLGYFKVLCTGIHILHYLFGLF